MTPYEALVEAALEALHAEGSEDLNITPSEVSTAVAAVLRALPAVAVAPVAVALGDEHKRRGFVLCLWEREEHQLQAVTVLDAIAALVPDDAKGQR